MNSKTAEWRPGPSVCRCCLSEGCYKDISTEYFWMGKREVYAEMLADTFDLTIAYSKSKGPNSNSRLICEPCISRLRDATDFKRQVQECERTFLQHLDPAGTSDLTTLEVTAEPLSKLVKLEDGEEIKEENLASDFDDVDDVPDFGDDDDDDLDDQPLTTLASKTPKKESVDFTDLLDNAKAEKRKSSSKAKASPAKKVKTKKEKVVAKPKPEKKKKGGASMSAARRNAKPIVAFTTAYPFRLPELTPMCVFCFETYEPSEFRQHMETKHANFLLRTAFSHSRNNFIKVDITDLRCRICQQKLASILEAAQHLNECHIKVIKQKINLDIPIGLQPFKFAMDKICCVICDKNFPTIRLLSRHMATHYQNYVCDSCGRSYVTRDTLLKHISLMHATDQHVCKRCKKGFTTLLERRKHINSTELCWPYNCYDCNERFRTHPLKVKHQVEVHGAKKQVYQCPECVRVFGNRKSFGKHFAKEHEGKRFICSECGRDYSSNLALSRHYAGVHKKKRSYQCSLCSNTFLTQLDYSSHMKSHGVILSYQVS